MPRARIAIVGGGSFHWGPGLIRDFLVSPELQGSELVLHDVVREAAEANRAIGEQLREQAGADFSIEVVDERRAALRDADYVVVTIAVGGLEAWRLDMEIPDRHGVRQTIADTVGPGGLSRSLRHIPVLLAIARDMEEVCPGGWLINVTNPMTTLTRAIWRETGVRCIGLCHELFGCLRDLEAMLGVPQSEMHYRVAGINHCTWMTELSVRGEDGLELLRQHWREQGYPKDTVAPMLFEVFGALPVWKGRHLSEFFPHFLTPESGYGERYGFLDQMVTVKDRYEARDRAHARWLEMRQGKGLPGLERGGEPVAPVVIALAGGEPVTFPVNWPNLGQVSNLPLEAVVETPATVDVRGVTPHAMGALPAGVQAVLARHVANQELIVEAAVRGDRGLALQALVNDPLVRSLEAAWAMLDELLGAHARYLPQFAAQG